MQTMTMMTCCCVSSRLRLTWPSLTWQLDNSRQQWAESKSCCQVVTFSQQPSVCPETLTSCSIWIHFTKILAEIQYISVCMQSPICCQLWHCSWWTCYKGKQLYIVCAVNKCRLFSVSVALATYEDRCFPLCPGTCSRSQLAALKTAAALWLCHHHSLACWWSHRSW